MVPEYLKNVKPDPLCCACHHPKHIGRCRANAGTLQHCLCERFEIEPLVFACFRAICRNAIRRMTEHTA